MLDFIRKFFQPSPDTSPSSKFPEPVVIQRQVLVLVINSLKEDFIQSLKNQVRIEPNDCDRLYRDTQFLWLGDKGRLPKKLKDYDDFVVDLQQKSEYDVYLVSIELEQDHPGFRREANQMDRINAFRTLTDSRIKSISPRLKVEVYENTGVY
jgi:hypothetical protein